MSAAGRSGASIFAQGPAPAGSARGAPIPANEDERRRFPTWSLCPQLRLHEGQATTITPRAAQPLPFRSAGGREQAGLGGSPAPRSRGPVAALPPPGRPRTARPVSPPAGSPGPARYPRGAAPLFVERPFRDLLPRRRPRPAFPGARRPLQVSAPPPPAAPHVLSQAAEARTVAAAAAAPRPPPGAASPGETFPASVGRRPAARPSAPAAGPECRPEVWSGHDTLPAARPPCPPAWHVLSGPGLCYPRRLRTPAGILEPTGLR
ncbi:translation initiation factor IF-2-like [Lutra lutra]|uniref:translation initiation factor IF-2-like n=1 Tax=Lutra lutra TaxID=9657 RepID=UPI001FD29D2E|nr:translation initiation factor IF-2-like [Lutra lutra]